MSSNAEDGGLVVWRRDKSSLQVLFQANTERCPHKHGCSHQENLTRLELAVHKLPG